MYMFLHTLIFELCTIKEDVQSVRFVPQHHLGTARRNTEHRTPLKILFFE